VDILRELAYWKREFQGAVTVAAESRSDLVREVAGNYARLAAARVLELSRRVIQGA
jgi:hypothetical protein